MKIALITDFERAVINRLRNGSESQRIAIGDLLELPLTPAGWKFLVQIKPINPESQRATSNRERLIRYMDEGYEMEPKSYGTGKVKTIKAARKQRPGG